MRTLACLMLVGMCALTGCSRTYVMRMTNGAQITTASKPKLKGNNYVFKDAKGRELTMPAGRVQEILPASMIKEEKSPFIPTPSR